MDSLALRKSFWVRTTLPEEALSMNSKWKTVAGDNKSKAISSKIFDETPKLLTVDLSGNICIDGFFKDNSLVKL